MQLVPVILQALDELLDGPLRFEREERETKGNVSPLARVFGQSEALAELFDDVFRLFFLGIGWGEISARERGGNLTFSIKENM